MNRYRVTYNGYTVEFFDSIEKVNEWIDSKIDKSLKIINQYSNHITPMITLRVYQYYTLYSEMFMIEIEEF